MSHEATPYDEGVGSSEMERNEKSVRAEPPSAHAAATAMTVR